MVDWPTGPGDFTVNWRGDLGVWIRSSESVDRFGNMFGIEDPTQRRRLRLISEINVAKSSDVNCRALFVTDRARRTFLVHSGGVGGGSEGVGKSAFLKFYRGQRVDVVWPSGKQATYLMIGRVGDKTLPERVATYVRMIAKFKRFVPRESGRERAIRERLSFLPESERRIVVPPKGLSERKRRHGLVVNTLYSLLSADKTIWKNDQRDLFELDRRGRVRTIVEVKTGTDTGSIYAGIGQLLFHGKRAGTRPRLILVLPGHLGEETASILRSLGIRMLTYRTVRRTPRFLGLQNVMA
jgi:hypothetical protein